MRSVECKKRTFKGIDFLVGPTGEGMMVTLMTFKKSQEGKTHSHPNEPSGYCIRGRFTLTIDKQTTQIVAVRDILLAIRTNAFPEHVMLGANPEVVITNENMMRAAEAANRLNSELEKLQEYPTPTGG